VTRLAGGGGFPHRRRSLVGPRERRPRPLSLASPYCCPLALASSGGRGLWRWQAALLPRPAPDPGNPATRTPLHRRDSHGAPPLLVDEQLGARCPPFPAAATSCSLRFQGESHSLCSSLHFVQLLGNSSTCSCICLLLELNEVNHFF